MKEIIEEKQCKHLTVIANSIGAFFALSSLDETLVDRAYFISPVVDMENLICNMMQWSNVTEHELAEKREITTDFGETLSWEYLCYVRQHPIIWNVPICILYGKHDNLTSIETVSAFAKRYHADLTVMPGGEHASSTFILFFRAVFQYVTRLTLQHVTYRSQCRKPDGADMPVLHLGKVHICNANSCRQFIQAHFSVSHDTV